jgi:two-component system nitrate/nitrite response regulator NarL
VADVVAVGSPVLRVAVLVGNEVLRRGLEVMLKEMSTVDLAPRLGSVEDCRTRLRTERFDVLLVSAFDADVLAGLRDQVAAAGTRVLMLVDESAPGDVGRYARLGVDGFLSQQELHAPALREALDRCAAGQVPMPASIARALLAGADQPAPHGRLRPAALTGRETQTLHLLAEGLSNGQIARRLGISGHGAKRLVAGVLLKLGAPNRTAAVVTAIRTGLVDCPPA